MKDFKSYIKAFTALVMAAVGITACQDNVDAPADVAPEASLTPNTTLLELKEQFWDEATNYAKVIKDDADPEHRYIIHGNVISSDEEGNVFKSLIIQDETAALAFSIDSYNLYLNYRRGQEIVLDVTGMDIGKYAGLQQIGRKSYYENGKTDQVSFMAIETFRNVAQLNGNPDLANLDTIQVNSFGELKQTAEDLRKYQSQLVRLKNVYFEEAGKRKLSVWHTKVNEEQNTNIIDRNGSSLIVRTSGYSTFFNMTLPEGNLDIVGILSYYNSSWQLILIDGNGIIKVGDQPGTKEKPYTVEQAIADEQAGIKANGWVKGYIVGTLAPEVEDKVASDADIQWEAPFVISTSLVIGPTADCRDYSKCIVMPVVPESVLQQVGALPAHPENLGKEIMVKGDLAKYLDTWGLTGNSGKADEFSIEGVSVDTGEVSQGDGTEAKPYNVAQVISKNPTSTTVAVETGVWVEGYIVGSMPTGGSSTTISGTNFSTVDAATTNLVLGPTADCTDYSKCVGVQLPSAMRQELALANKPGNLGKKLAVKGDIMKYCGGPGVKNLTENKLGDGGSSEPEPDVPATTVTSLNVDFETSIPSDWKNIRVSGDKSWYQTSFNDNGYAAMTGYKGTQPPFDAWLVSPGIDIDKVADKNLTFRTQVNGYGSTTSQFRVFVLTSSDPATASRTELKPTIATAPASGYSSWVESGNLSLAGYTGTIYIGFEFYATQDANYATWCVDDIKLNAGSGTVTPDPKPEDPEPGTPGEAVTLDINDFNNGGSLNTDFTADGYHIVIDKASGATAPAINQNKTVRLYAKNTMTISGPAMAKIVFVLNTGTQSYRYTTLTPSTGKVETQAAGDATITWNGNAGTVTFTVGNDATLGSDGAGKRGQIHFTELEIYPAK